MDLFVSSKRIPWVTRSQARSWLIVCELRVRSPTGLPLHLRTRANFLSGRRGLSWDLIVSFSRRNFFLDDFRNRAGYRTEPELPPHGGSIVRRRGCRRTLRRIQRQLDPRHPNHGAPGELAGIVAR